MNVFCDFHHASLLQSLLILFEGRLGGNVYRPIGLEWFDSGFWAVYDHPATAQQFLSTAQGYRPLDGSPPLNIIEEVNNYPENPVAEIYYCRDIDSGQVNKAITLESFKALDIDIVIASLPQHVEPFKRLIREHKPNAKLIYQIGNAWTIEAATAPNIMASAIIHDVPPEINFIQYHQEFDLNIFHTGEYFLPRAIYSFVNVFQSFPDWHLFEKLEQMMPDWKWRSYGGQCRDGAIGPAPILADKMREAEFIFHVKASGDGYGHVLHNAAAVGTPLITNRRDYRGKLGEALMIPDVTCIDIDGLTLHEIIEKVDHYSEPSRYNAMSYNIAHRFAEVVDFDREFEQIKEFLSCLK
jgi:hypothetical protein